MSHQIGAGPQIFFFLSVGAPVPPAAAAVWPVALPSILLVAGYREQPPDLVLRTQMDVGPAKMRRRMTAGVRPIQGGLVCTKAQLAALETFYIDTIASGSLPFDWINSRTGAVASMRFVSPPRYEPEDQYLWRVTLDLEIMP